MPNPQPKPGSSITYQALRDPREQRDLSRAPPPGTSPRATTAANWGGVHTTPFGDSRVYAATGKANYTDYLRQLPGRDDGRGGQLPGHRRHPAGDRRRCWSLETLKDGTTNTIAFGEKRDGFGWAVGGYGGSEFDVWISPTYTEPTPAGNAPPPPSFGYAYSGSYHPGGAHFAFCDGSVRWLKSSTNQTIWYALTTRDGKEVISADSF